MCVIVVNACGWVGEWAGWVVWTFGLTLLFDVKIKKDNNMFALNVLFHLG